MTEDERAIRDLVETWFVSSRRGDLATVLDLIADDAIFMVAGKPPFDKAAFAAASRDANAATGNGPKVDGRYRIDELRVMGDWAYLRNFLEIDVTPPGGGRHRAPLRPHADDLPQAGWPPAAHARRESRDARALSAAA